MSFFAYSAVDAAGRTAKGNVEAESVEEASRAISGKGLYPVSIRKTSNYLSRIEKSYRSFNVGRGEVIEFAQSLSVMLKAGMPVLACLEDIISSTGNKALRSTLQEVKQQVERGSTVSGALAVHSAMFPDVFMRLVTVGERTGRFDESLQEAADHLLRIQNLASAIKKALMYPAFAIVTTLGALIFWLAFVLPKMAVTMTGMGVKLPTLTLALIAVSKLFQEHWKLMLLMPFALPLGIYLCGRHARLRYLRDLMYIKAPVVKLIVYNKLVASFAEQFRILLVAGLPIEAIFDLTIPALGNEYFAAHLFKAKESVLTGKQISESLRNVGIFPQMVIRMIGIGETSGTLDHQLEFLAKHYTKKLDDATEIMGKIIEPVVMVVVGGMFAVIIMGLMLPIYDLVSKMGK